MQQLEQQNSAMTFDEVSMERSKSFMKALQELKNLRPQLYSAAEYCEKSYLHNEQKQMVLDNLKDYAVRAIVNAVDHLGTVAYKLSDLFEQQTLDISTVELKISCLNQQLLTCQTYTDKEGLKQQQLLAIYPRHHKHYVLPGPVTRKPESCTQKQSEAGQKPILVKPRPFGSGPPSSKTLSWHLASETNSAINGVPLSHASVGTGGPTYSATTSEDAEAAVSSTPSITRLQLANVGPDSSAVPHTIGVTQQGSPEISKTLSAFRSLDNPGRREIPRTPVRSKSVLSGLFGKHKSTKQRMSQRSQN